MEFGTLHFTKASDGLDLIASSTKAAIRQIDSLELYVAQIDDKLSDTVAFCAAYQIGMEQGANCVILEPKRGDRVWYAACVVLGTDKIDVNGAVRKQLDAKKVSFAPMEVATDLTAMEYGGITPIGLRADWPILIDSTVAQADKLIIRSGVRASKLLVTGHILATIPNALMMNLVKN